MKKIFFKIILFLFLTIPSHNSNASTFFFFPQNPEYQESETFITDLYIDTEGEEINTIQLKINFSENMEVIDVMTGDSIIDLWTKSMPKISNEEDSIEISGGILGGYKGKGNLIKIIFKINKTGKYSIELSDIIVLLNDGKATEVEEVSLTDNSISITEKQEGNIEITSKSNPDPDTWSSNNKLELGWELEEEEEYSYILSKDPFAEPDNTPDEPEGQLEWMGNMSYEGLEDGIYYFRLKKKIDEEAWTPTTTIRAMIDTVAPEEFKIQIVEIEGKQYLVFETEDTMSGIDHYEVLENNLDFPNNEIIEEWKSAESPYLIQNQNIKTLIKVRAIDKAGNETVSEIIFSPEDSNPVNKLVNIIYFFFLLSAILTILFVTRRMFFKK